MLLYNEQRYAWWNNNADIRQDVCNTKWGIDEDLEYEETIVEFVENYLTEERIKN